MKGSKTIETLTDRYPLVGPIFWVVSIQFFITQLIVARAWPVPYSIPANTISDLGNTACGVYSDRYVCSPLYSWMNASFIILGLTMLLGSVLIYHELRKTRGSAVGFGAMAIAGLGTVLVGLFPESTISPLHGLGAGLTFVLGAVALIVLGYSLDIPRPYKIYTVLSGAVALVALIRFVIHGYLGLGIGGMERLAAHPITIWLIIFGIYMSSNHFRSKPLSGKSKKH